MVKKNRRLMFEVAYASSLGLAMVIAIFGSLFFGMYLDRKLNTGHVFAGIFLILGIAAGFRNFYLFIKKYIDEDTKASDGEAGEERGPEDTPSKKDRS